jgi:PAS domain S-box-containing protein
MPSHPTVIQRLKQFWLRLTEPHPTLQTPEERRQVRFLISLLLALTLLIIVLVPLWIILLDPKPWFWQETPFQIGTITSLGLIIAYSLSRTRYYSGAALLAVVIIIINVFIAAIPNRSWTEILVFDYLLLAILLSSIFFSLSTTVIIAGGCLIGMLFFPIFVPTIPPDEIVVRPVSFILMGSVLILLTTHHRNLLEKDRQAALAQNENKYRSLLEQAADGIFISDQQGNYLMVNPKGCEMLGYSLDEMLRLNIRDIVLPQDLAETPLRLDELRAGKTVITERSLRRKDGTSFPAEISAKILKNGQLQAIVRDITRRKQIEEKLKESESRLSLIFNNVTDWLSLVRVDPGDQFRVIEVNQAVVENLGLPREAQIGKTIDEIFPEPLVSLSKAKFKEAIATKTSVSYELTYDLPRGRMIIATRVTPVFDEQGCCTHLLTVSSDVTERRRAEEVLRTAYDEAEVRIQKRTAELAQINENLWAEIVERKRVERALKESQRQQQALLDNIPDIAWLKDKDSRFIAVNEPFARVCGFAPEALVGKTDFDIWPPDLAQQYRQDDQEVIRNGRRKVVEELLEVSGASQRVWIETVKTPIFDEQGEVVGTTGIARDITTRKQSEELLRLSKEALEERVRERTAELQAANAALRTEIAERKQVEAMLRESEERYRAVVENQTELVIRSLPDTTVTFVNEAYCQFFGLTRSQIIGRKYLELIPQPAREATQRHIADLIAQPRIAKDEHETLLPDGQIVWQQWIDRPILDAQGRVIEFLSVGRDITERKKAEEALLQSQQRLATAQAIAHFGNWELNPKTGQGYWSEEMFHIHSRDPRLGAPSFEEFVAYIHPEDRAGLMEFHAQIMRSREPLSHDYRINRPDGSQRYLNTVAYSVWDETGQLLHLAGTTLDITERKQVEAEIQRLNEELEQRVLERTEQLEAVNKEMEAFSYSVSHDLRAPLRAIDGFSQALLEDYADKLDEDGQDYLQRVRKATQRMGRLIDDMLGLSRITRSEMHRVSVNLSAIVEAIAAELQQAEPQRLAEFVIAPEVSVEGDPHLLHVALENLMGNAWKFTQKQPHPRIEFGQIQKQDKLICFIRDNGVGFDMNYADKLFGPFQRLHTRHEFEGSGIGLATVQRVIMRHGGRIWAESAPGQGATFYFIL